MGFLMKIVLVAIFVAIAYVAGILIGGNVVGVILGILALIAGIQMARRV